MGQNNVIQSLMPILHRFAPSHSASLSPFQNSAFPGVLGIGITSRMLVIPVTYCTAGSRPSPNPACGTVPYFRKSMYHQ